MDSETHPRPRRTRHDSAKHYDRERKDLELSEVLDVLQRYVDYGGGINCCVCGKLYKSRVCFIKHLWEHTIYWDLFAGDKNHMRVLSIQAALILYGTCQQPLCPVPVDSLLVTSPHSSDSFDNRTSATDHTSTAAKVESLAGKRKEDHVPRESDGFLCANDAAKLLPTTPVKNTITMKMPGTPRKKTVGTIIKAAQKRKAPPTLDISSPPKISSPAVPPGKDAELPHSPSPLTCHSPTLEFQTPVKQRIPFVVPKAPKKKGKRPDREDIRRYSRRVSRFFLPAADTPDHQYWKESDSCACKRKRSE